MTLTQAPIIVPEEKNMKKFNYCEGCKFEYNYILGNLSVIKENKYLEIKTDTEDQPFEVKSDLLGSGINSKGKIHRIRLYSPALNNYDSTIIKNVKAELIIEHKSVGDNGRTLSICIPISETTGDNINEDSKWLDKIISKATRSSKRGVIEQITGSGPFTLNKLIPRSQYIVLENTNATWGDINNTKNNIIIMTTRGCTVSKKTIEKLQNNSKGIEAKGDNICTVTGSALSGNCWRFSGDSNPFGNSDKEDAKITVSTRKLGEPGINLRSTMTCYPIDTDGNIIKAGYLATTGGAQQKKLKDGEFSETAKTFLIALGIIAGVILAIVLVSFIKKSGKAIGKKLNVGQEAASIGAKVET
tara:strand:- start:8731 stop:9804 length:1074 start_codon:yes stop_codon:yes gene_type:complete